MSDLTAAAQALGVPEAIVERSAQARATETGTSVDEVLALWAGGGSAPTTSPVPVVSEATNESTEEPAANPPVTPPAEPTSEPTSEPTTQVTEPPPPIPVAVTTTGAARPPVLVGVKDNPMLTFLGAGVLFVAMLLVGLIGPSQQTENPGARTSAVSFSDSATRGREVFANVGCVSCHTQMVRPVTADVGLGAVTLNDSNQILGSRRFGPDLSNVGARLTADQLGAIVGGSGGHPALSLSDEDLANLVAYLSESVTLSPADSQQGSSS